MCCFTCCYGSDFFLLQWTKFSIISCCTLFYFPNVIFLTVCYIQFGKKFHYVVDCHHPFLFAEYRRILFVRMFCLLSFGGNFYSLIFYFKIIFKEVCIPDGWFCDSLFRYLLVSPLWIVSYICILPRFGIIFWSII